MYSAKEMFDAGLLTAVFADDVYLDETIKVAKEISNKPAIAVQLAKECIMKAYNTTIEDGIQFERRNFYLLFSSEDKIEGMKAFIEKRKPVWKNK
jgi:enoyl-CoA hydratase